MKEKDILIKNRPEHDLSDKRPTNYEIVLASILFLMTRYARQADDYVAKGIEDHLERLANHVDQDSSFMIRTCARLQEQWRQIYIEKKTVVKHEPARVFKLVNNKLN